MIRLSLALLFFWMTFNVCSGQRSLLMLQKRNKNKNAYYKPGDEISFRVKGSKQKITGHILDIKDSVIMFQGFEVRVEEIASLYIDDKTKWWLRYKVEQIGLLVGGGYLAVDLINTGEVNRQTLIISGAFICAGLLGKLLIGNRIPIHGSTRLRILKL